MAISTKENIRRAKQPGLDPQLVAMAVILGSFTLIGLICSLALHVSQSKTGIPDRAVPWNPLSVLILLIKGDLEWTSTATAVALGLAAFFGLIVLGIKWLASKSKPEKRVDTAQKYLASKKDINSLSRGEAVALAKKWLPTEQDAETYPGLRLGHVPGKKKAGLFSTWEDLYLVIFGPRMGKTTTQVIPAIVDAPGPVLTTSNKRDIVDDTIAVTSARGNVRVFDPQRIARGFEQQPWFFDPLDALRRDEAIMDSSAIALADIFLCAARGEAGGESYWWDAARDLMSQFFLAAALDNRPISIVYRWCADDTDKTPLRILKGYPEWEQQAESLAGAYATTEKTRSGFFAHARQMAAPLGRREAVRWVTPQPGATRFDADEFVRSAHDTLYILSKEGADNAAALTTALTAAVMKAAEEYGEANGGRLPVPLVAPLDEAANVVKWPELPRLYSHYGSRSIILMTILQSYAQGVSVWGEEGMEALWSASAILLYGGGVRDEKMLQKMELLIGEAEEQTRSVSLSKDSRSVSTSLHEKKILTAAELASLEAGRAVVFASKRRPLIAALEPWWERDWPAEIRNNLGKK